MRRGRDRASAPPAASLSAPRPARPDGGSGRGTGRGGPLPGFRAPVGPLIRDAQEEPVSAVDCEAADDDDREEDPDDGGDQHLARLVADQPLGRPDPPGQHLQAQPRDVLFLANPTKEP